MKDSIIELNKKNELEYRELCEEHITKANTFNLNEVIKQYYSFILNASSDFTYRISNFNQLTTKLLRQVFKAEFLTKPKYRTK